MKKRILAILTATISVCALSGCNVNRPDAVSTPVGTAPNCTYYSKVNEPMDSGTPSNTSLTFKEIDMRSTAKSELPQPTASPETANPQDPPIIIPNGFPQLTKEELTSAIHEYPLNEITLPDGSTVSKYEAVSANGGGVLIFPFAFYRIASPIYKTTNDDPSLIKYGENGWEATVDTDALVNELDLTYKKAIQGDTLENGLTVSAAVCCIDSRGEITNGVMELGGEVTLSGYLTKDSWSDIDLVVKRLHLRPDTTKASIPVLYSSQNWVYHLWDGYRSGENDPPFYMYFDGEAFDLGNRIDTAYNELGLDSIFGDNTTVAATITLSDIRYSGLDGVTGKVIEINT